MIETIKKGINKSNNDEFVGAPRPVDPRHPANAGTYIRPDEPTEVYDQPSSSGGGSSSVWKTQGNIVSEREQGNIVEDNPILNQQSQTLLDDKTRADIQAQQAEYDRNKREQQINQNPFTQHLPDEVKQDIINYGGSSSVWKTQGNIASERNRANQITEEDERKQADELGITSIYDNPNKAIGEVDVNIRLTDKDIADTEKMLREQGLNPRNIGDYAYVDISGYRFYTGGSSYTTPTGKTVNVGTTDDSVMWEQMVRNLAIHQNKGEVYSQWRGSKVDEQDVKPVSMNAIVQGIQIGADPGSPIYNIPKKVYIDMTEKQYRKASNILTEFDDKAKNFDVSVGYLDPETNEYLTGTEAKERFYGDEQRNKIVNYLDATKQNYFSSYKIPEYAEIKGNIYGDSISIKLDPVEKERAEWKNLGLLEKGTKALYVGATRFPEFLYEPIPYIGGQDYKGTVNKWIVEEGQLWDKATSGDSKAVWIDALTSPAMQEVYIEALSLGTLKGAKLLLKGAGKFGAGATSKVIKAGYKTTTKGATKWGTKAGLKARIILNKPIRKISKSRIGLIFSKAKKSNVSKNFYKWAVEDAKRGKQLVYKPTKTVRKATGELIRKGKYRPRYNFKFWKNKSIWVSKKEQQKFYKLLAKSGKKDITKWERVIAGVGEKGKIESSKTFRNTIRGYNETFVFKENIQKVGKQAGKLVDKPRIIEKNSIFTLIEKPSERPGSFYRNISNWEGKVGLIADRKGKKAIISNILSLAKKESFDLYSTGFLNVGKLESGIYRVKYAVQGWGSRFQKPLPKKWISKAMKKGLVKSKEASAMLVQKAKTYIPKSQGLSGFGKEVVMRVPSNTFSTSIRFGLETGTRIGLKTGIGIREKSEYGSIVVPTKESRFDVIQRSKPAHKTKIDTRMELYQVTDTDVETLSFMKQDSGTKQKQIQSNAQMLAQDLEYDTVVITDTVNTPKPKPPDPNKKIRIPIPLRIRLPPPGEKKKKDIIEEITKYKAVKKFRKKDIANPLKKRWKF